MKTELIELGTRINDIIIEKGLKPTHVACEANIETKRLIQYIHGIEEMKVTEMLRIAKALDVEVWELFN